MHYDTLSNDILNLQVSAHGAELCSIRRGEREYLWQADPTYWKRHSPVLFPIVGSVWQNEYRCAGQTYRLTQHGFARDRDFQLVHHTAHALRYRLTDDAGTHALYPYAFRLDIGYRLEGACIHVEWEVENPSDGDMYFQIGAHPAFYYPDYRPDEPVRGFFRFDRTEGLRYVLIAEQGCADPSVSYPLPLADDGLLPIDIHTFDRDALILQDAQVRQVALLDTQRRPVLRLTFDAPVVGLWSPPAKNAPFVCIEPWYGRCDRAHYAGDFKDKDWMQHLGPHAVFKGGYTIEVL